MWGVYHLRSLAGAHWGGKCEAEELHRAYLSACMGVKSTAPTACLMESTGRTPVWHAWMARSLGWFNGIAGRRAEDVVRVAMQDSMARSRVTTARAKCSWGSAMRAALHAVGGAAETWSEQARDMQQVPVRAVISRLGERWRQHVWGADLEPGAPCPVRGVPDSSSRGFKLHTFKHWFHVPFVKGAGFPYCVHSRQRIVALARMSFGAHDLAVEQGRWRGRGPRDARKCECCDMQTREDEQHFLLECPAYAAHRTGCSAFLGAAGLAPLAAMQHLAVGGNSKQHWNDLADFLIRAGAVRRDFLRSQERQNRG